MRRIARVDRNQEEIVRALRGMGATVQHLHTIGKGCPDILVGFDGKNYLMEIKSSTKQNLTLHQRSWHKKWQGETLIISSVDEAISALIPQSKNYSSHGKSHDTKVD